MSNGEEEIIDEKYRHYELSLATMTPMGATYNLSGYCNITRNKCSEPDCRVCFVPNRYCKVIEHC